jgi:hypothetical protein
MEFSQYLHYARIDLAAKGAGRQAPSGKGCRAK